MTDKRTDLLNSIDPDKIRCKCGTWVTKVKTLNNRIYALCPSCYLKTCEEQQDRQKDIILYDYTHIF